MIKSIALILILLSTLMVSGQSEKNSLLTDRTVSYKQLETGFSYPPAESRLRCYWWWLNSMATKESITRDLEEMKDKGYGGASLVDAGSSNYLVAAKTPAGPVFMSPEWMELYQHAVQEADRVGIQLSVNMGSGWNPGGPSITPEFALKKIVWSEVDVVGGKMISNELPQPEKNLYYQDICVQAIPNKEGAPVQNEAIENWKKKSFNEKIGWKGVYPLYELREDFDGDGKMMAVQKDEIIDLTGNFKNGKLEWNAPKGDWTIIRYGYTCTGARTSTNSDGWEGLSVDHLSPEAFELFSQTVITPLIEAAQSAGKSVKFLQTDSWEMDLVSWTKDFPAEFKKYRGYDIQKYMPALAGRVVENRDETNRFLHDFRKTVGDCVAENHYRLFYELAHKYGMGIHPESGGPHSAPVDALRVMGISDFPQGEFWAMANTHRIKDDERLSVRQSACVAHTNGKRFVAAEGPTSIGPQWERSPMDLKGNIDRVFCSGVNRIVWHTFTSSPKEFGLPGNEYFAGTHLNPNVTWWKQSKDFISYLDRSMYMLQQGLFVADVLSYYGDDVPNFVFLKEDLPDLNFGYDWDKCSKDVILNRVSFDGEKIVLPDGMSYRVMMIPNEKAIDLNVLKKLEHLVKQGMTLIGPKPEEATGLSGFPQSDKELKEISDRMWGKTSDTTKTENQYGKGRIIWGQNVNQVLADLKVMPDFQFKGTHPKTSLDYIHRTTNDQEIYLVSNRFSQMAYNDFEYRYLPTLPDRYEQVECSFRVSGKVPEVWNAITGETEKILVYREENGRIIVPLLFEPEGSKFIVFRNGEQKPHIIQISRDNQSVFPEFSFQTQKWPSIQFRRIDSGVVAEINEPGTYDVIWSDGRKDQFKSKDTNETLELSGEWNIQFDPKWGGPANVKTDQLKSWTDFEDPGIKYYSGTATYHKTFKLSPADLKQNRLILDLGNVKEMASVKLNGHQMQVLWCAPFRFDITPFVKSGTNELEVEVVNMWPNRLIGDGKLPESQRLTKTNINKFNGPDAAQYLRVSGLMGPVKISVVKECELK
ncbi:MAG TPA: glycosyl hydrolase [Prolixibacteraceae bacterium]|nr:glycosyl hydrolase [Prolixibacteraceae bacterium]